MMYGHSPWVGRAVEWKPLGRHAEHRASNRELGIPIIDWPAWMSDGLCAQTDPEAFFPEKGGSTKSAKRMCSTCPVQAECLEYALEHVERFGIWGGLSERERRTILTERKKSAA